MDHDLLDSLLDLEEGFYKEGYDLGVRDGARAGYSEGSVFAVEKGFEKFQEMGRLYGKAIIWAKRLPGDHGLLLRPSPPTGAAAAAAAAAAEAEADGSDNTTAAAIASTAQTPPLERKDISKSRITGTPIPSLPALPALPSNPRLQKQIALVLSLVDPLSLSLQNSEDAVADFDERLKKAASKAKVIERVLGEQSGDSYSYSSSSHREGNRGAAGGNIEDIGPLPERMLGVRD
ncbi:uncharacterized protein PADG_02341 [Paracoccidioides brasiliensis Pb18]|uniref:Essential protein Yae1 N-terminal domain-containing protein n=1 Tax=Paracoccidioides brasiliensis (strain Pb18) TaxID=502780 RepID=C1G2H5_PARBD|nr:uncharacterized protein PADG_02341 [Paracoccidioides brasiliensis Pb18]EEH46191.1 hypothetical protein PADG_02341 [Paracoccidioides brasiliensis Pb18]